MSLSLNGRRFSEADRVLAFREDLEGGVTATYAGGTVVAGSLTGRRDGRDLEFGFTQIERNGVITTGRADARLEVLDDGRLRLHESWKVDAVAGTSTLEELAGPQWLRTRVAHPTRSIPDAMAFYGELLGCEVSGPYDATPDELVFFSLPGGAQLELTAGGAEPLPASGDDLLVLYVPTEAGVAEMGARLARGGVPVVAPLNVYWEQMGITVRDPDGRLVVIAQLPA